MMEERHEKNLKDALRQLPHYRAPESIWDRIEQQMEQEAYLHQGIAELPVYAAPNGIWNRLEQQLEQEGYLHQAIAALPVYTAPDQIWNSIENELNKGAKIRRLSSWSWSVAAGVAIVVTAALGIYQWGQTRGHISYAYSEEKAAPLNSPQDWDAAEADVQEVQSMFAHFCKYQSSNDEDCALERELKELNEAKAELKDVMARFGEDPDLIRELSDLEQDRSRVVKAMVEKIQTS